MLAVVVTEGGELSMESAWRESTWQQVRLGNACDSVHGLLQTQEGNMGLVLQEVNRGLLQG